MNDRHRLTATAFAVGWSFVILVALLLPGSSLPDLSYRPLGLSLNTLAHVVLFFIHALSLWTAVPTWFGRWAHRLPLKAAMVALFSIAFGALTELLQYTAIDRHADAADVCADAAGVFLFLGTALLAYTRVSPDNR
ncbi:MAG: VanZ family protein [Bacteroidota bacterium]|nr:VanZ family protein [Bacteroidota bacterium]